MKVGEWEEVLSPQGLKYGDLIWMECLPGGICIFLKTVVAEDPMSGDTFTVHHPTEGIMEMPDYYFITVEEAQHLNSISPAEYIK